MEYVPNIDVVGRRRGSANDGMRTTVAQGKPPDLRIDDRPRVTPRGRVRIATAVEWRPHGTGLFTMYWANHRGADGRCLMALYSHVRWRDESGRTGLMTVGDFNALRIKDKCDE